MMVGMPEQPSFRRQYRDGLDLEQRAGTRQLRHTDCGAGRRRSRVHVLVAHLAVMREIGADIDDIVVELDDMLKPGADRGERRLYVLERNFDLLAGVGAHRAGLVDAELAGKVDGAARSGDFDDVAVARRLLYRIGV